MNELILCDAVTTIGHVKNGTKSPNNPALELFVKVEIEEEPKNDAFLSDYRFFDVRVQRTVVF